MIHRLKLRDGRALRVPPPQRRRVVIVGAGSTGMSAAFHIGEHALLLERRHELEQGDDQTQDACATVQLRGAEDSHSDDVKSGLSARERHALFTAWASPGQAYADGGERIHVTRWQPPTLAPEISGKRPPARHLAPLLRGELRLGAHVVRVNPAERSLQLADGTRFIFDKMVSTIPLGALACLVMHELPGRVRHDASLRYWLQDHDIEVADRATRELYGDIDEFAAGRQMAERISPALAEKFHRRGGASRRHPPLFQPRLVRRAEG